MTGPLSLHALTFSPRQIYTVSEQNLAQVYGVSQTVTVLGLTLFILGYGTGPSESTIAPRWDVAAVRRR